MKKKSLLFTCLLVVVTMALLLCGCGSTYGKIEKAFKDDNWEVVTEVDDAQEKLIKAMAGDDYESTCTVHSFKKKSDGSIFGDIAAAVIYCTVLEFKSNKDMEEKLKDKVSKEDAENIYNELQKLDFVNGNCVFVGVVGLSTFKSTK